MKKISTYQIIDTFRLTGLGIVFAGNISNGSVSIGDWIEFNIDGTNFIRMIIGIEGIRSLKMENNCGLHIQTNNDEEVEIIKKWEPNGIHVNIYSDKEDW